MSRTTTDTEARRRRAAVVLACLTIALAFNAGALVLADRAAATPRPALAAPVPDARPAVLLITPRARPEPPRSSAEGADTDKSTKPTRAPQTRTRIAGATMLPARLAPISQPGSDDVALRFFRLGEIDEPAEPAAEWSLDLAALDELGLDRIAFELLIDDRGAIITCSVAAPLDLPVDVRHALEQRLQETQMRPAVRDGVRVASYRRIELYAEIGGGASDPLPPGAPLILSSVIADR
jgi:hypothetical protein